MNSNIRQQQSAFWKRLPAFTPSTVEVAFKSPAEASTIPRPAAAATAAATAATTAATTAAQHEEYTDALKQDTPLDNSTNAQKAALSNSTPNSNQQDKANSTNITSSSSSADSNTKLDNGASAVANNPIEQKFYAVLSSTNIDVEQLKKLSWKGIPSKYRCTSWQLLMGYLPLNANRRDHTVQRKRKEYDDWISQTFSRGEAALDRNLWHQIKIDVPRTTPGSPIFQNKRIQASLERVLYCWAVRHPASGYVQGINDLLTPFYFVFLEPHMPAGAEEETQINAHIDALEDSVVSAVEADSFWCLSKLLDGIQDNYTHAQPGIQRQIVKLKELVARINSPLACHLETEGVEFIQFAFRWINCLLMREVNLANTVRMWDTYLAEADGFSSFHIYVCAAFLLKWDKDIQQLDFQKAMLFLQHPPTDYWTTEDIELLLSEAYMYKCLYHDSPNHYASTK